MRQLFGTDGIRGVAGEYPLDPATVYAVGAALGEWAREHASDPEVVIGMDTRESGPLLAGYLSGGLAASGVGARPAGLVTTPGIAHLTRWGDFVAGVMISASHNPYLDNGIKVFSHSGYKLPDAEELELEGRILGLRPEVVPARVEGEVDHTLSERYLDALAGSFSGSLRGVKLVLDCGHGAASRLGPALFERLGATVVATGCSPNGRNINEGCGALHVDPLARRVVEEGADAGFAFDGDADRSIGVAASGRILDGDAVLLITARHLKRRAAAGANGRMTVVATVMSNLGLEKALAREGIDMVRTPVGDKYVLEEMLKRNARLGGEQSGHVIFRDYATTGDGLLTALRVLEAMQSSGQTLDELISGLEVYPQVLVNVRVKERRPLEELGSVQAAIAEAERTLGREGRVLVRFSGTEPLARVMVEGPTQELVESLAQLMAGEIRRELGGS